MNEPVHVGGPDIYRITPVLITRMMIPSEEQPSFSTLDPHSMVKEGRRWGTVIRPAFRRLQPLKKLPDLLPILECEPIESPVPRLRLEDELFCCQACAHPVPFGTAIFPPIRQFARLHAPTSVCYGPGSGNGNGSKSGPNSSSPSRLNSIISSIMYSSSAVAPSSPSSRATATETISTSALIASLKALILQSFPNSSSLNRSLHLTISRHKSYSGTVIDF